MTATECDLEVVAERDGKRHKIILKQGSTVLHLDRLDLSSEAARKKFLDAATSKYLGLDRERIEAELLRLAANDGTSATQEEQLHVQEVDVSRVIRPELFHTHEVSGITVAVLFDVGGKLMPRWRTHLRWSDGKREVIDTSGRILLPDSSMLYVHPNLGEPPGSEPPAWSADSRRTWLEGTDSPDPCDVFKRVSRMFAKFLDFPPNAAPGTTATLTLWSMLTYVFPAWDAVQYLYVGGPMGSGKSRVLDVLQRLVFRPMSSSNLTAPVLFRSLHANGGTMLFDEAERLKQSTPEQAEIQSVFLSGYRRGGCATRLEPVGDSFRPVRFDVYGPKCLACIAGLPPTLASRCIPITMFRSASDSQKPKLRIDGNSAEWQTVRDDLHVLAMECGPEWMNLASRRDVVPDGINGRNYELWQPLLALAGWLQERGAAGLLAPLQQHALASVMNARDDAIPEADETLLELMVESIREGHSPTSGELLTLAKLRDEVTFKMWNPKTVTNRLKSYGIAAPQKSNGERRYRNVTCEQMKEIQTRYCVDLGMT